MPLSLWFILQKGNSFEKTAQELISQTIPNIFFTPDQLQQNNHHTFPPHVTITSGIQFPSDGSGPTPQEWLDSLDCTAYQSQHNEIKLELDTVQAEDAFFRKCNIALKEDSNLMEFATLCRRHASSTTTTSTTTTSSEEKYRPHLSLLYADLPTSTITSKLPLIEMKVGFAIGDLFACCGGALCIGGRMVLVDTGSRPIGEWKDAVVAERETPFVQWRITRNLV